MKHSWVYTLLPFLSGLDGVVHATSTQTDSDSDSNYSPAARSERACQLLEDSLPGLVFFPGSSNYTNDNFHYGASSTQNSTCTVEPSTNDDISTILKIIGREDVRSPFAVKSGGHTSNLGFSSTSGVMISLSNFNQIINEPLSNTVTLGPGATWDEVYAKLEVLNLTVVGGRIPGVGVGGLLLGGGYSWYTDEYGLALDNILSYDLVLPNGTFIQVTESSQPDLSFALRGGFNNFGIVTSFTVNSHPNNGIWAGTLTFPSNTTDRVFAAVEKFSTGNQDPKASLILTYVAIAPDGESILQADLFYDAPQQPEVFTEILDIPSLASTVGVRTLTEFLLEDFAILQTPEAGYTQHVIPTIHYTVPILNAIKTQVDATFTQAISDNRSLSTVGMNCEPFMHPFAHAFFDSAYPHSPTSRQVTPGNPLIFYNNVTKSEKEYFDNAVKELAREIQKVVVREGEGLVEDIHYSNYALADTPLELIYGGNLERLRGIKRDVDPMDVMGLSGGFKV
ncbi:FAD-binding domain-containing protein [Dendrothele bispora CBS 962.96]|uniref:FAD-binding domain-containing protein n=1 Tax=Dendrothele bispora (strain CBS 962.96) TaxID=1314807 RepID=A0A4S8KMW7_DENBC|nr:FAD-binding domain-containing protein [Dendrothele bispora CBS 962.96]